MRRRALLASLAGSSTAALTGCIATFGGSAGGTATDDGDPAGDEPADGSASTGGSTTADSTPSTAAGGSVTVAVDALQPALVTRNTPDSIGVSRTDGQYLYLSVDAEEPTPALEDFAFRFGDREHAPLRPDLLSMALWRVERGNGTLYEAGIGAGLLLFELPETAADTDPDPALTWPGGEWRPDERIRRRLAAPEPPLSASFQPPETIRPGESPTLSVTATNEGDLTGRFVAGLNRSGPYVAYIPVERISLVVPAGETVTRELTDDSLLGTRGDDEVGDGQADITYHFDWTGGNVSKTVRYVSDGKQVVEGVTGTGGS